MKPIKKKDKEKVKKVLKKEYIPVTIAVLILIILILVLLLVIFYKDEYGMVLPDAPKEKNLSVEIYDFVSAKYDPNDLTKKELKNVKVKYLFVTDYYKEGIILSNTTVDYIDNNFVIYSGPYGETPFVSIVDIDGRLKWIYKLDSNGYDSLKIKHIEKLEDEYYVFASGSAKNKYDNMVLKIDSKGKLTKKEVFDRDSLNSLSAVTKIDNGFAVSTEGDEGLIIYSLSKDLKLLRNAYNLKNDKNNIFHSYNPYVTSLSYKNKVITAIVQYNGLQDETMYLVNYNIDSNSSTITSFKELMKLGNPYTSKIWDYSGDFIVGHEQMVYKFNNKGEIAKSYDYSKIKLKEDDLYDENGDKIENYVEVEKIKVYDSSILVSNYTNSDYIYDVFDKNIDLKIRYMLSVDEYETKENVLLDVFYINDKLYEVHSYGFETPSIMISIIG